MAVILHLTTENRAVTPFAEGEPLAPPTPLDDLPDLQTIQANPYDRGQALFRALGGDALLARLDADPEEVLLLALDPEAESVPWEFAALAQERELLAIRYGLLRLVDRDAPPPPTGDALHFIALAADPLVDQQGHPREGYRLGFDRELPLVQQALARSGKSVVARRIPPTKRALRQALRRGPAWLHISAHGDIIETDRGPVAVLFLEDQDGQEERLLGPDLVRMAPRGVLRLALLSACHTADGDEARLARALVLNGVPAAVGMQGPFPDSGSGPLAEALYDSLLAGLDLAEAMRQARQRLLDESVHTVGLPVAYVARDAWGPLEVSEGPPDTRDLRRLGRVDLPAEVQPPAVLQGRHWELHQVAQLFSQGARVVTLIGAGGMGKTALAATFARRFAWRWPQGVAGISFAAEATLDARAFRLELIRHLLGEAQAQALAEEPPARQEEAILKALPAWDGLLLVDNYESVLQALEDAEQKDEAEAIHRLLYRAAKGGQALLLTSREHPAGFPGERTYPQSRALWGLSPEAGAALFLEHSSRARPDNPAHVRLALDVAQATEGHPLAIILLAGEFDTSQEASPEEFLANWPQELAQARRAGLAAHHVTFAAAFQRSYRRLAPALQERLRLLSVFSFPFLAQAAAFAWGLVDQNGNPDAQAAQPDLETLHRRSLLQVDATFAGADRPATYRFLPAVREEVAARLTEEERARAQQGYAAYGAGLIDRGFGSINQNLALARLVRLSMDALEAGFATQEGTERLWKGWRLAWLKRSFGQYGEAMEVLREVMPAEPSDPKETPDLARAYSHLVHEMANIHVVRGELDQAMGLYQQSLAIKEALGDQQGKSATLHAMANIHVVRGELGQAMGLYRQSLAITEALGDQQGKSATLHEMATIYRVRGELDQAMGLYQQSLAITEALGDQQGRASTLTMLGQLLVGKGQREEGIRMLQGALAIFQRLGMPREVAQVQGILAQVEDGAQRPIHPIHGRGQQAQSGAQAGIPIPLEALPPELQEALEAALAKAQTEGREPILEDLPPEVQQALAALAQQLARAAENPQQALVEQVQQAALAVQAGQMERETLLHQLDQAVEQIQANEVPDSPWMEAAGFLQAVAALLRGQEPPPVPARYAEEFAALKE